MQPLGDAMHHLNLLARMGKAMDVDLAQAFARDEISAADWAEMIQSCRGCSIPQGCQRWLEAMERGAETPDPVLPPQACCNAERLVQLRQGQED